jgi:hypothetical protein
MGRGRTYAEHFCIFVVSQPPQPAAFPKFNRGYYYQEQRRFTKIFKKKTSK